LVSLFPLFPSVQISVPDLLFQSPVRSCHKMRRAPVTHTARCGRGIGGANTLSRPGSGRPG
jgi:hypothetical protein